MIHALINQQLGRYLITALLGRGGMAAVYRAHDATLQRDVALKVLYPHYTDDQTLVERFKREAITAASLEHPHIVSVYDVGEQDGVVYIAMKLLSGYSLYDVLNERGAVPLRELLPILEHVASALDYAHQRGIVHRDIKPGNILLELPRPVAPRPDPSPTPVARDAPTAQGVLPVVSQPVAQDEALPPGTVAILTDLGIAKSLDTPGLTTTGAMLGTPDYMAPEQISGGHIDRRTDVYALGVLAYRALTGQRPFSGVTQDVLMAHLQRMPAAPSQVNPSLSPALDTVILGALAKQPEERYASAGAFVQALRAASMGQPVPVPAMVPLPEQTTRPNPQRPQPVIPTQEARPVTPARVVRQPRRRQGSALLIVALLSALFLIASGLAVLGATRLFGSGSTVVAVPTVAATDENVAVLASAISTPSSSPTLTASATSTATVPTTTSVPATPSSPPATSPPAATAAQQPTQKATGRPVITQTVVVTPSPLPVPSATLSPIPSATSAPSATPTDTVEPTAPPPTTTATDEPVACDTAPLREKSGFKLLYESDFVIRDQLGCPAASGERAGKAGDLVFASGTMYWWSASDTVYVLPEETNRTGTYHLYSRDAALKLPAPPTDVDPRMNSGGGFARVYYGVTGLPDALGVLVTAERNITGAMQVFEHGTMLYSPANGDARGKTIYVLYDDGTFRRYDDTNPE